MARTDLPTWDFLRSFKQPGRIVVGQRPGRADGDFQASWRWLLGFKPPPPASISASWDPLRNWIAAATAAAQRHVVEMLELARTWDERLSDIGGEINVQDWRRFRPLRLDREEDWSDWLAHLIGSSRTGRFASRLLRRADCEPLCSPRVDREISIEDGTRRADLVILWVDATASSLETKVGDRNFDKTFETAAGLRSKYPQVAATGWTDFILLPAEDLSLWDRTRGEGETLGKPPISSITWTQVAIAVRQTLWNHEESAAWRAWAYAFCGAIEQSLLEHSIIDRAAWSVASSRRFLSAARSQLHVLKEGQTNG